MEKKFAEVIIKILRRMHTIEEDLTHACGSLEKQRRLLGPFLQTLKPILALLGVSSKELILSGSSMTSKALETSINLTTSPLPTIKEKGDALKSARALGELALQLKKAAPVDLDMPYKEHEVGKHLEANKSNQTSVPKKQKNQPLQTIE